MKHFLLFFFVAIISSSQTFSQEDSTEIPPAGNSLIFAFPSCLQTGEVYLKKTPANYVYKPSYTITDTLSHEGKYVRAGLLWVQLSYLLKKNDKISFFKTYRQLSALNTSIFPSAGTSPVKRLEKNWLNKDSVFTIIAEEQFERAELFEMNDMNKRYIVLLHLANTVEAGISFYNSFNIKPKKEQRDLWNDLECLFRHYYDALAPYENESARIKTVLQLPRITDQLEKAPRTAPTVVEKDHLTIINGGGVAPDEVGKIKTLTDAQIKSDYEKLIKIREVLLNN